MDIALMHLPIIIWQWPAVYIPPKHDKLSAGIDCASSLQPQYKAQHEPPGVCFFSERMHLLVGLLTGKMIVTHHVNIP